MPDITVLITGGGTACSQSVIKALRSQHDYNTRIVTVDMQSNNAGRWYSDAFHNVPVASDPAFLDRVLDVCRMEKVDMLIPIVDYEFDAFAANKSRFAEIGCRVVISDPAAITQCNDKLATYEFFRKIGVETPKSWLPQDIDPHTLQYPVFIKPRFMGRASIDAHKIRDVEEFEFYTQRIDKPLIQEAVVGDEFTVDVLCDFEGRALNGVVRRRIETKAGVSYKGETVKDNAMLETAVKIAEALPIIGPANIQCFKCDGRECFFEINPRYSGTLVLSIAAGFNSPAWLVRLALGEHVERDMGRYEAGVRMMRYWQEVFVDCEDRKLPDLNMAPQTEVAR